MNPVTFVIERQIESLRKLADNLDQQIADLQTSLDQLRAREAARPAPDPVNRLISVRQAAEHLNISRSTMYEIVAAGTIPTVTIGSTTKIRTNDLDAYTASRVTRRVTDKKVA